jgi:putrescine transport system substrate-binding protein
MRLLAAFGLVLAVACVSTSAISADRENLLNIYNWSDYIDPELIEEFEREYGIKVNYDIYDSSEIVDTKLLTGHSGYDVVVHSASF